MATAFVSDGGSPRWPHLALVRRRLPAAAPALVIGLLLATVIFSQGLFGDGDTGWHIGAGEYMLRMRTVPHTDPFSYTFHGAPWTAHEWLAEVAMAGSYLLGGWSAEASLFLVALGATGLLVVREAQRWMSPLRVVLLVLVLATLLRPSVLARPHLLALPLFTGWLILLLRAQERRVAPPLAAVLIMLIWANLHASYLVGLAIAGLFTVEGLWTSPDGALKRRWLLFGLGALLAACVTPHGAEGFLYPFQVSGMRVLSIIQEWRPTTFRQDPSFVIVGSALLLLILRAARRVGPVRLIIVGALGAMALAHFRHQPLFGVAALLIAAPEIGRLSETELPMAAPSATNRWMLAVVVILACVRLAVPYRFEDTYNYPLSLLSSLPADLRTKPVLNEYSLGGPLIMDGFPVAIDGRADMYGDAFTFEYLAIQDGDMAKFHRFVKRWNVAWTIFPAAGPLAKKLDHDRGWRRLASNGITVIYVRR
jgi:hypothetical protein